MSLLSLLCRSIFSSWLLTTLACNVGAVANTDSNINGQVNFSSTSSSTLNHFKILPISTPSDVYWPLENPTTLTSSSPDDFRFNTSTLTAGHAHISCNGRLYGRNFNLASCLQVWHLMSSDTTLRTFGVRGSGEDYEAPLPFRYLSVDGLCAIDLSHASGVVRETVAPSDLKDAAELLIQICVNGRPSEGGLATGLGVNKGLALRIVRYQPTVTCGPEDTGPPWITCARILDNMPTDSQRQVYGPPELENTTVALPWSYTTLDRRCAMIVDGLEPGKVSDASDWYKIWAAANAVSYMCVHQGKRGVALSLGKGFSFCQYSVSPPRICLRPNALIIS